MQSFYDPGKDESLELTNEDHAVAAKAMKTIAQKNELINIVKIWMVENNTKHMCAPFDAEWEYVSLERMNVVDAMM